MKRWSKRSTLLLVIAMLLSFSVACAPGGSVPSTVPAPASSTPGTQSPSEAPGPSTPPLEYPEKPVELVVPFAAGGAHDMYSRAIASVLPKYLGTSVNVNLVGGGSGTIGMDYAAHANPDGYSLLLSGTSPAIAVLHTRDDLTYSLDSFEYISYINGSYNVIEVPASSPFNSLKELFDYAKEHPGELRYATSGVYSASHITTEAIADAVGLEFVHVPYDSGGASTTALVAGEVDFGILGITASRQLIESGMLKAFALTSPERDSGSLSDIPTMAELGYDGNYYVNSRFIMAPKGTPQEILDYVEDAVKQMCEDPDFIKLVEDMGEYVEYKGHEEFYTWVEESYTALKDTMERLAAAQ